MTAGGKLQFLAMMLGLLFIEMVSAQGGGGGGGGRGGGGSRSSGPEKCRGPDANTANGVWVAFFISVLVALIMGLKFSNQEKSLLTGEVSSWATQMPYKHNTLQGTMAYHGFFVYNINFSRYYYMSDLTLTVEENKVTGAGEDVFGKFTMNGDFSNLSEVINMKKLYIQGTGQIAGQNFGHTVETYLFAVGLSHSNWPSLFGHYYVPRNGAKEVWFIVPKEGNIADELSLKNQFKDFYIEPNVNKYYPMLIGLVFVGIVSIIISGVTYSQYEFSTGDYSNLTMALPWDIIFNFFVVIIVFPLKIFKRKRLLHDQILIELTTFILPLFGLVLNLAFGIIKMSAADWIKNIPLFENPSKLTLPFPEIHSYCNFSLYKCAVLDYQKKSYCKLGITCISFSSKQGDSCYDSQQAIFQRTMVISVLSLLQYLIWTVFLYHDIESSVRALKRMGDWIRLRKTPSPPLENKLKTD